MTQDEIIEMAKQAHISLVLPASERALVAFAQLVAAKERDCIANEAKDIIKRAEARGAVKEREACAEMAKDRFGLIGHALSLAIKSRGEA